MVSDDAFKNLILAVHEQKGELLALQALVASCFRVLTPEQKTSISGHLQTYASQIRNRHLFSPASDDVIRVFDVAVGAYEKLLAPKA